MASHGEVVSSQDFTVLIYHITGRHLGVVFRVGDNLFGQTSRLIGLGLIGNALGNVVEPKRTSIFGHDNGIERIPLGNEVALLYHVVLFIVKGRTVRHIERREHDIGMRVYEANL